MKKIKIILLLLALLFPDGLFPAPLFDESILKEGDIIFQESRSPQSLAIQRATNSNLTHAGLIIKVTGKWTVLEAIEPVTYTALSAFISRSTNGNYFIKRLKNDTALDAHKITEIKKQGKKMLGTRYDPYFEWSDSRIYCTELIWKLYHRTTGLSIGQLQELQELNLKDPAVESLMRKRYGSKPPHKEPVITPESMFRSDLLKTIYPPSAR